MGANAQTSVPLFVANAVLTAAQQNISAATGIPVFATTVTRDAAFGGSNKVLAEGQLCYLESTDVVQYYTGAAWATVGPTTSKIAQVVQATTATGVGTSSTSYVTSGLTTSITPTLNTSKVLVMVTLNVSNGNTNGAAILTIFRGTVAGTNLMGANGFATIYAGTGNTVANAASNFLDSPATTSATTYTVGIKTGSALSTATAQDGSATSTMTLIEILA